ncbi:MAG TPA: hypothetical protein DHW17_02785 [Nitrospina sp.]|nr:hypothetical protein [Nitrospina sp.]
MKKVILFVVVSAFLSFMALGSVATADDVIPGTYVQHDASVMGVGQTVMQFGASARILTNAVNLASGAGSARANSNTGAGGGDYQFGSSQTEQSWKAARTIEEAQVRGLVPGDCNGDNSDGAYRSQMNQNRKGFMKENLVSNANCEINHATMNQSVK